MTRAEDPMTIRTDRRLRVTSVVERAAQTGPMSGPARWRVVLEDDRCTFEIDADRALAGSLRPGDLFRVDLTKIEAP
jgi:hypothetical protein